MKDVHALSNLYLFWKNGLILISQVLSLSGTLLVLPYLLLVCKFNAYNTIVVYFEVMSVFLPFYISILIYTALREEDESEFISMLSRTVSRKKVYWGKVLSVGIVIALAVLTNLMLLYTALFLVYGYSDISILLNMGCYILLESIFLINLHLYINMNFNSLLSFLAGGMGMIIVGIIDTGIGDKIWIWSPWNLGSRLSVWYCNTKMLYSDNFPIFRYTLAFILFIGLLTIGGINWFRKWEGRRHY